MGNTPRICVVLGTRPEIIKMSPILRLLRMRDVDHFTLHTGQHYSHNMGAVFFQQLHLEQPKYNLHVGSGTHGEETGRMLQGIEQVLMKEKPDIVLVEGDTNTVLAGALAAAKLHIKIGHVEAGLRSFDMSMPEEVNRIVADHVSDLLFAPTKVSRKNLLREGIEDRKVHVTGNTIVDAVQQYLGLAETAELPDGLAMDRYFLATLHRQENVDDPETLKRLMEALARLHEAFETTIIYLVHPRARKRLREYGFDASQGVMLADPVDYFTFLRLERSAALILTDSGGVQEEACILRVPCLTLRNNTERQETVDAGANEVAGTDPETIVRLAREMIRRKKNWKNPYGDGKAAERILEAMLKGSEGIRQH
jgi:UDP-N-acetylglucosamine 2-epimerase (non-hydrolysing)